MVSFSTLYLILLLLAILNFFLPSWVFQYIYGPDLTSLLLLFVTAMVLLLYYWKNRRIAWKLAKNSLFGKFILLFWILVIIEVIYSKFLYGKSFSMFPKLVFFYLILAVYFVLSCFVDTMEKLEKVKHIIVVFAFLMRMNDTLQHLILSKNGYSSFYLDILAFSIVLAGGYDQKKRYRSLYISTAILQLISYFVLYDNTAIQLIFAGVMLCQCLIMISNKTEVHSRGILRLLIIVIVVACVPIAWEWVQRYIARDIGVEIRTYAIEYFLNQIKKRPILGMGFIDPKWGSYYENLLMGGLNSRGGNNQFYLDDIGIIGFTQRFGLVGAFWMIMLIKRAWSTLKGLDKIVYMESMGLIVVIIIMCISLCPLGKVPICIFPLILLIIDKNNQMKLCNVPSEVTTKDKWNKIGEMYYRNS